MFHQRVTIPESHPDYPSVWQSECGKWRVIRCVDDLQYVRQHYRSPKWRNKSYYREWESVGRKVFGRNLDLMSKFDTNRVG